MNHGKDPNGNPFNSQFNGSSNPNGNFNGNLTFPFQMPSFFPQQQYMQQGNQSYEDMSMDNFNAADAQLMQHNQFGFNMNGGANMNQQYSPSNPALMHRSIPSAQPGGLSSPDPPQRAAELRQKLIAMRKSSASPNQPTAQNIPSKTPKQPEAPMSLPRGPSGFSAHAQPGDTDLENLLSEARSAADGTINGGMAKESPVKIKNEKPNNENVRPSLQTPIKNTATPATNGSRGMPLRETQNTPGNKYSRRTGDKSSGEASDMSDGEIVDDPKPRRPLPPTGPKESELTVVKRKLADDQAARDRREELAKQPENPDVHSNTKLHRSPTMSSSRPAGTRYREERGEVSESRTSSRRPYHHEGVSTEREPRVEQKRYERREEREPLPVANVRGSEPTNRARNERVKTKSPEPVPLLERVLAENDDLRTWLNITGWYDTQNRASKLKKYHEWIALSKEFGGIPGAAAAVATSNTEGTMLPPPTPTKVNDENTKPVGLQERITSARRSENASASEPVVRKRGRVEDDDENGRDSSEKYARIDSEGRGIKIKGEGSSEYRRPDAPRRSYGESDSSMHYKYEDAKPDMRRRSLSPRYTRPDSRDSNREYGDHGRGRGYNYQDRDMSGQRAFESRPPARKFIGEQDRDRDFAPKVDNDDWKSRRMNEGLEADRGDYGGRGYRGKQWDPNYHENRGRGGFVPRGRGRGRGGYASDMGNMGSDNPRTYGNGSASRPKGYKEAWDRGDKGESRFFILKSYNEENIIHCQKDSIWTTQEHNADMLIEAFKTCKNVIFCFSINSSKHFQGYARMESLPGSVDPPTWFQQIRFPTAGAFRVRWLTVANTHFSRVGHLKNTLNEDSKVYVGKDGQEIEEGAGRELVNIIDEEFEHKYKNGFGYFDGADDGDGGSGSGGGYLGGGGRGMNMGRGDGRGYRTYRDPGTDVGEIRGW